MKRNPDHDTAAAQGLEKISQSIEKLRANIEQMQVCLSKRGEPKDEELEAASKEMYLIQKFIEIQTGVRSYNR